MGKLKANLKRLSALISASLATNFVHADAADQPSFDNSSKNNSLKADVLNTVVPLQLASHRSHSSHASHSSHRSSSGGGYGGYGGTTTFTPPTTSTTSSSKANTVSNPYATSSSSSSSVSSENSKSSISKDALKTTIQRVQLDLTYKGYYKGDIDGIMGKETRAAIKIYRTANNLGESSYLDAALLNSLGIKYSE